MTANNDRLKIRELPESEQPLYRAQQFGTAALSNSELIQLVARFTYDGAAEELLQKAGSLSGLASMSPEEMCESRDVGEGVANAVLAAFELGRRHHMSLESKPQITSPTDAANILMMAIGNKEKEHMMVLLLDTKNRVMARETVYIGNVNSSIIRPAEVFQQAIKRNATAVIIAHNHPSGDPTPSPEDIGVTRQLVEVGNLLGIEVLDHVIVGHNRWTSLKERGLGF